MRIAPLFLSCLFLLSACGHNSLTKTKAEEPVKPVFTEPAREGERLRIIVDEFTQKMKRVDPFFAAHFNVEEDLDKFGDYPSPDYLARVKKLYEDAKSNLAVISLAKLEPRDQLLFKLIKTDVDIGLKSFDFPTEMLEFNQMENRLHFFLDDSSPALTSFPFDSVKHYDDFVRRSRGFPQYVDNQIALFRKAIKSGVVLSCAIAKQVPNSYQDGLIADIEKNPFWRPILAMPKELGERERLARDFRDMVSERIIPGFRKFDRFYRTEYLPRCRKSFGLTGLPQAESWYRYAILNNTGLNLRPQDLYQKGLSEVARIEKAMILIKNQLKVKGPLKDFLAKLRADEKRHFSSASAMIKAFDDIRDLVDKKLPKLFSLVPKTPFKVVENSNPESAAGAYDGPTDLVPYGRFLLNTKNPNSMANWGVTTLYLHEAIPGHHFQLALQFELKDKLTEYQRKIFDSHAFTNAFTEGWALYAESLGYEMNLYDDPYQRLGNLNDEMLRACRLVVDTGIHHFGWPPAKAKKFMASHLADSDRDIAIEVNRFAAMPAQALSYKVGQFKFSELRKKARNELGDQFDVRDYHRVVLENGTITLPLLEEQVSNWINQKKLGK